MQHHPWDAAPACPQGGPYGLANVPYSTRFFAGTPAAGDELVYTVPAGYVAVVRDIELLQGYADTQTVYVILSVPGPLTVGFAGSSALASLEFLHWSGRVVANAGDELYVFTNDGEVQVTISGYLLSSP